MTISAPVRVSPVSARGGSLSSMLRPCKSGGFRDGPETLAAGRSSVKPEMLRCDKYLTRAAATWFATIRRKLARRTDSGEKTGHTEGAVRFPCRRRAPRFQAERVRRAGGTGRPRHRPGFHDEARGKLLDAPRPRVAAALPAHPAEYDPRPFPALEGALDVDHAAFQPGHGRRGRRRRSAGNIRGRRDVEYPRLAGGPARAVAGDGRDRGGRARVAGSSTRGLHAALLGGTRRERDRQGD